MTNDEWRGSQPALAPLWRIVYEFGVEVVLSAHGRHCERRGIPPGDATAARSGAGDHADWGVPKLIPCPRSYRREVIPVDGRRFTDGGGARCHGRRGESPGG